MSLDSTAHMPADSPIGDIAYLTRSEHRIPALIALTERPQRRAELCELTGVSASTMRRTLDEFDDRVWIRKDGHQYVATRLGEVIASGIEDLLEQVETERKLRDVWHWLPDEISEFPIETWSEMSVTVAEPDSPYRPVNRFKSLLRQTTTLRFLHPEVALMEPCFSVLDQLIDDGADIALVDRPSCHTYFLSTYPERSAAMLEQENFTVLTHDDVPACGIGLLDERVIISCYGQGSGTVQALIVTAAPDIREWAESVYERYASDARHIDPRRIVE
ncbi:helix-turn-helix transcriptional regulator [Natronorubrum thiooxidans]|uniref:Transcriptional regulator, ArsR family n=1 Tax=Natronorubrum thiooxidans TaxID=308853 RepID=A0A1N7BZI2_9EURY|nr:MarR family transcriptional regulator [Natronorubrum thiooxidans]SIR56720.1 transcriptional regulator, ArsR family [Natronorubrum thiooxidans]